MDSLHLISKKCSLIYLILLLVTLLLPPATVANSISPISNMGAGQSFENKIPIKWALITLGDYNYYYRLPQFNPTQKTENWIQSRGVPYDEFPDDLIEAPTNNPSPGKYPLQNADGSIRYQVIVLVQWGTSPRVTNKEYILWAVGNGTNAIIFGFAAKSIPELLGLKEEDVIIKSSGNHIYLECTVLKTFNDGLVEYKEGDIEKMTDYYTENTIIQKRVGTVWFNITTGPEKLWFYGMFNTTYGKGNVWFNFVSPHHDKFLGGEPGGTAGRWEDSNWKFAGHAINFMFNNVEKVGVKLLNYKRWNGAIVYRLDQDTTRGIVKIDETALQAGWVYDVVICPLGYLTREGTLSEGMPENYTGAPSSKVKHGVFSEIVVKIDPEIVFTKRAFIVYNSSVDGPYDTMKVDWNQNFNFEDDVPHTYWENHTEASGILGTYYWCYIDNETDPTRCRLGWWCPLRDRIKDFTWWREMGKHGYLRYGFHSWHHQICGNKTVDPRADSYVMWNGRNWIMNQTWIMLKYEEARNELAYCLGSSGYGFEADKCLHSVAGAQYHDVLYNALGNLSWIYLTYHQGDQKEIGWYLCNPWQPASPGFLCGDDMSDQKLHAYQDLINTLYPYFTIIGHNYGSYNLNYSFTPYSDKFVFAHLDESFEFWFNARYMKRNTVNAYATNNKIILEYKANNTLRDYVWKFPIRYNGKYFNGFLDNRTLGKIKHIDGKYVYIEFNEGDNEKIEAVYGNSPHIHQLSGYLEKISQEYKPKNLHLQLWNVSGTINIKVNCMRLQQPASVSVNGSLVGFNYNPITGICSFNITLNGLEIVDIDWAKAPPNPPTLLSPDPLRRFNPYENVTFIWKFDDPDTGDTQFAYRFQLSQNYEFTSPIMDTGKVMESHTQSSQKLPSEVGLYYWRVKTWDNQDTEGEWSDVSIIIVDRLIISDKKATANRTSVGNDVTVYFKITREFDNKPFEETSGIVYINDIKANWDEANKYWKINVVQNSVGEYIYKVSYIVDCEYNIATIVDVVGEQKIVWDQLIITIIADKTIVPVDEVVKFEVRAKYAYDDKTAIKFTAEILKNGTFFATNNFTDSSNIPCTYQYTIGSVKEETYGLTAFKSNTIIITWTPKPFTQFIIEWLASVALTVAASIQLIVVGIIIYLVMKKRKE